jgi:ATP-dependent helicase Lhr and Lhr-like helicase
MELPGFHPLVSRWFTETLGPPTAAQERGWAAIRQHQHTLIAAPTGSGKTLAAFLTAIDDLVREGESGTLPDEVRVVYVSPLKALSADIHKNLAEPRRGIQQLACTAGVALPPITAAVRTGDTSASERAGMLRTPPHILVTTPESLYLLLTSDRSRRMLRTARTVIVDEIHAVIGTRRGAHLALSLERLQQEAGRPLLRLGLSATQKPVEEVARYLVGTDARRGDCAIVDEGHRRALDLAIEMPRSPLDAVMAQEVWEEYYDRLAELIESHTTTLVFVNTRRLAERVARHLSDRIGAEKVTAHHGSLSKDTRLDAEHRLKTGALKALVATASLELGIDIGHVDLVCQVGSPHRIATLLQRVGRAGHTVNGVSKGRLLPTSRDDLIECVALLRSVRRGDLDRVVSHDAPLDVLAQQIAAEVTCREYVEDELFAMVRNAWPYRAVTRADFDAVVGMVAEGFSTRRGRRAALVHRDEVHATLRGRRSTRLLALTSGGAIPEVADYRVILEPEDTFIGTLNEDFAIESMAGDIFQLGNASWRITQVAAGVVRVADAHGAPPNIPFWFGEAPARSDELSKAVSELRTDAERWLAEHPRAADDGNDAFAGWMQTEAGICEAASEQGADYFADGWRTLGVIPSQETLVLERFFDESGGMQLVLHAPFGSRINRAWGLALRKRFCRQFNFELQAAATEDALLLSLGPQHSFPLADVFRYLHAATVRDILVQAFLDAPVFQTRWRWNATISLAVPRYRGGRKVPPQIQRMQAEDLMAAVFPDAAACLENIPGDREIPDHPLVRQTVRDCLEEAMDLQGLTSILTRIHAGELRCVARDMPEPSVFAHEILNARPYAFLDDAPLEERRTQAVQTRRAGKTSAADLGALDAAAIARVIDEERPDPRDAEELHDVLLTVGCLTDSDFLSPGLGTRGSGLGTRGSGLGTRGSGLGTRGSGLETLVALGETLAAAGRATYVTCGAARLFIAAERLPELLAVHPGAALTPTIAPPDARTVRVWSRVEALRELVRGRLSIVGPTTVGALAAFFAVGDQDLEDALLAMESEGAVLRGSFTPGTRELEWCDRRLLSRIHRYTLNRLRAEIAPVSPAEFMRFLFVWQHVDQASTLTGVEGLRAALAQLDGTELPARAWERHVLPARVQRFEPAMLDMLCLTGEVAWARLSTGPTQVVGATPIAIFLREHADAWLALGQVRRGGPSGPPGASDDPSDADRSSAGNTVLGCLRARGASFSHDIATACSLTGDEVRSALCELVANGVVSSDGFAGLRAIVGETTSDSRRPRADHSGRWFALDASTSSEDRGSRVEMFAWALLRRYGVVFRRLLAREATDVPWRDVARVYRRLEARGEIRGGRFVTGMSGEQFALADAVERLREVRRSARDDRLIAISAADPLNLTGLLTSEERVRVAAANRIVYRNGVPLAAMEGDMLRTINASDPDISAEAAALAAGRRVPVLSGYVGRIR